MNTVYNIIEIANVHGGDFQTLERLVDEFKNVKNAQAIKFQPFKYDKIAQPDFSWYAVYEQLYFTPEQWKAIISKASKRFDVWIDTFDEYSLQIINENIQKIKGLKFQSSILYNRRLFNALSGISLKDKKIIINISGIPESEIVGILKSLENKLQPEEIILQVGFQGYPTELKDNGLNKVSYLKKTFKNKVSFADHIDFQSEDSILLPVLAVLKGAEIIEKHVKPSGDTPKYDFYSSLDKQGYQKYLDTLMKYTDLENQPFINEKETNYLQTTIQIPTLRKDAKANTLLNLETDFDFKRTNQRGLRTTELSDLISNFHILATDKKTGDAVRMEDMKKATIATIIACRLKSSRLPKKALLKIGDLPSVEFCLKNALKFQNINHTILATSDLEEDADLENYRYSSQVIFHKGHPLDVINRYLGVIEKLNIDVIVRITADMPYVSDTILQPILRSHFESGADYSRASSAAIGTNLEVINTEALKKVKSHFPSADYSEYMTYYFTNNRDIFKINEINLDESLVRDYRLTLDYPEDLEMFNKIEEYLKEKNLESNLKNVFEFLDANSEVAKINSGLEVRYHTDKTLVDKLNKYTKITKP
jgi:N,N'-diacetyllegionaminate synthase